MSRPKKGTKEGDIATKKWHATMEAKYGSPEKLHEVMRELGRKGGRHGRTGGFNSDKVGKDGLTGRERAKIAGAKGGSISKRGPAKHSATKTKKVAPKTEPNTTPVTKYHVKEQKDNEENKSIFKKLFRR